jgi:quercetin dioxygenase-like cupin family protein
VEPKVFPLEDLRRSPTALLFQGREDISVSMFVTEYQSGGGPDLHLHPYAEMFLVETGFATFTVGEDEHRVEAGNIVVVPPETPHGFKNREDEGTLRVVSVHPSPTVKQTDL